MKLNKFPQSTCPQKGSLLIAEPLACDDCFYRSVILLLDVSSDGVLGLVLNRLLEEKLDASFSIYGFENEPIYCGGPVDEERLFYIHNVPNVSGVTKVSSDLYVGGDLGMLSSCLKKEASQYSIKFFRGYTGWSAGQLNLELEDESWVLSPLGVNVFAAVGDRVWSDVLLFLDNDYYLMWLNFPVDPMFN